MEKNNDRNSENEIRKERRSRKRGFPLKAVLVIAALAALAAGIIAYLIAYSAVKKEFRYKRQPVIIEENEAIRQLRENLSGGVSVMTSLRQTFKSYLIIYDGNRYIFDPINYDRKMHNWKKENLTMLPSGEWRYKEGLKTISRKGIDVSSHQGDIDWKKVAGDGVEFAVIRAAYRGYESGKIVEDSYFAKNAAEAAEAGITVGAYFFSQALDEKELDEEVEFLLKTIAPYKIKGPVVMDIEPVDGGKGRADGISVEMRTALAKRFCEKIREAGYRPMLYYNYETALTLLDTESLEDCEKWYASYTSDFYYPYYYTIWQYTSSGKVQGIEGAVDMDISFEKLD